MGLASPACCLSLHTASTWIHLLPWPCYFVSASWTLLLMPLAQVVCPDSVPQMAETQWALASMCWQVAHTLALTDGGKLRLKAGTVLASW